MDVPFVIRQRLEELGLEQRDLARAARVTESYVSQILTRKKAPPAPHRTDIYDRMDKFLKLPAGELARVADLQRKEELKRELGDGHTPLHREVRELLLRKCNPEKSEQIRALFEQQPFGELERLVTQKLLDVSKVDTDVFHLSAKHATLLDGLVNSWDVDLATFALEVVLNPRVVAEPVHRFEFVEATEPAAAEPGLESFLRDRSLSGGATREELAFLKGLRFRFNGRRPTALYYYRELQSLRDPLHFRVHDSPAD